MEIDWKKIAKSQGYRSLKAACTKDVIDSVNRSSPMRKKEDFYKLFRWVIARAQNYAYHQNTSVEAVLDKWEKRRDYWWLNYYQESRQPKISSGRRRNVQPAKELTRIKLGKWVVDKNTILSRIRQIRQRIARHKRKALSKPARWGSERKKRQAIMRGV